MEQHFYHRMREVEDGHWWFAGRRAIVRQALKSLNLPRAADLLDVGCGTGGNLALLAQFGKVHGVELDDGAADLARRRGVGEIEKGALPDAIPFAAKNFDLAVMLDVLEHIDDDEASLAALGRLLKPRGYLLITVPAFMFLGPSRRREPPQEKVCRQEAARRSRSCKLRSRAPELFQQPAFSRSGGCTGSGAVHALLKAGRGPADARRSHQQRAPAHSEFGAPYRFPHANPARGLAHRGRAEEMLMIFDEAKNRPLHLVDFHEPASNGQLAALKARSPALQSLQAL